MEEDNDESRVLQTAICLITPDGTQLRNVSPGYALEIVKQCDSEWKFEGLGKNGIIHTIKAKAAPKLRPLMLKREFGTAARENAPRMKPAWRNVQSAGALKWKQQPMSADSGRVRGFATIHLPQ